LNDLEEQMMSNEAQIIAGDEAEELLQSFESLSRKFRALSLKEKRQKSTKLMFRH